jgi:hypothetical protein
MVATEYCSDCNEAVLWKCSSCEKENDKSVHTYHPTKSESSKTSSSSSSSSSSSVVGTVVGIVSGLYMLARM